MIGGVPVESGQQIVQVGGGELPLEWLCRGVVAVFEGSESVPDLGKVGEVVGRDDLALDDGEVDLHLVQPRSVDRGVDHDCVGERAGQPVGSLLAAVGGAVVDDGPATLRMHCAAGVLRIGAWDTDPAPPDAPLPFERSADLCLEDGRGLALVRACSDLWGWQPLSWDGSRGKLVWCELGAA